MYNSGQLKMAAGRVLKRLKAGDALGPHRGKSWWTHGVYDGRASKGVHVVGLSAYSVRLGNRQWRILVEPKGVKGNQATVKVRREAGKERIPVGAIRIVHEMTAGGWAPRKRNPVKHVPGTGRATIYYVRTAKSQASSIGS